MQPPPQSAIRASRTMEASRERYGPESPGDDGSKALPKMMALRSPRAAAVCSSGSRLPSPTASRTRSRGPSISSMEASTGHPAMEVPA
jgi:hypothetical protein